MLVKQFLPWWSKIAAKLLLSRLPIKYQFWKKLALFEHGYMERPSYAYEVFKQHFDRVEGLKEEFVSLELGPGDSLVSAMISRAFGCSASYLVDVGAFANRDLQLYRNMSGFLADKGLPTLEPDSFNSIEEMLVACSADYKTFGLLSLREIPDESVDFIWSSAVLEHIRRAEFFDTMRELRRIIRSSGVCSHQIDLRDHLGGALNNLRFSEMIWESDIMAQSGFYTNRIRYSEMLELFQKAGFSVEVMHVNRWNSLPTPKAKLHKIFQNIPEEELRVLDFSVILKPV